jgi:hypothetical protein
MKSKISENKQKIIYEKEELREKEIKLKSKQ